MSERSKCMTHGDCCHPEWSEAGGCTNCGPLPPGATLGGCKYGETRGERIKPDPKRRLVTASIVVQGHAGSGDVRGKAHVTVSFYPDDTPCEVFARVAKTGTATRTAYEVWSMTASKALQYGMPLAALAKTLRGVRGELAGEILSPPEIAGQQTGSMWDAIGRWMAQL